jgi:tetratricopeptide (TPR) repeat protein
MRIALADRYLEEGDLQAAFPHYQAVIEADPPAPAPELATAFARLGWIVYLGNGEVELATGMLDRALEVLPGDPVATYLKAQVRWCGAGDAQQAAELLQAVLSSPQLDDALRAQVEGELAAAEAGEPCP